MKRIISILLAVIMLLSTTALLGGCSSEDSKEFPVTIGNVTIKQEPKNIVVLSDILADVISYIGYDVKMVGRSLECDQKFLAVVPVVGSADNPSIDSIMDFETDLVIADNTLTDKARKKLEEQNITVITLVRAENLDELKTLYANLGAVLGGNVTGRAKGEEAYDDLIGTINTFKGTIDNVVKTAAYLYLNEQGELCTFTKGSIESIIFGYNGAMNVFSNQEEAVINSEELKMATPTFLFYDNDEALTYLMNDDLLSNLSALKANRVCKIPLRSFSRQGITYEDIVYTMIDTMFVEHDDATPDEATAEGYVNVADQVADQTVAADEEESVDQKAANVVTDLSGNAIE